MGMIKGEATKPNDSDSKDTEAEDNMIKHIHGRYHKLYDVPSIEKITELKTYTIRGLCRSHGVEIYIKAAIRRKREYDKRKAEQ